MDLVALLTSDRGRNLFLPAHGRGNALPKEIRSLLRKRAGIWDLPELPDLGSPFGREGAIVTSQKISALAVGADWGWYGVNGATGLLQAALLAMVRPGEAVLMPRNVHRSVVQACALGDITPVLFDLEFLADRGHVAPPGVFRLQEAIDALSVNSLNVAAAVLVNPTYHGYSTDISKLVSLLHSHGIPVLVDEAHGAHFSFGLENELPCSALEAGADLIVHSLHKSATGLVQTAALWLQGARVDPVAVERSLAWLQTTSPSALLLASCESTLREWHSTAGRRKLLDCLDQAREIASWLKNRGLPLLDNQDPLRLILHTSSVGITGLEADAFFIEHGIVAELPEPGTLTFCLGFGSHKGLGRAIRRRWDGLLLVHQDRSSLPAFSAPPLPFLTTPMMECGTAWRSNSEVIPLEDAVGKVSAELICPYPPGIPLLIPGESLDQRRVEWLLEQGSLWGQSFSTGIRVVK